MSRIRSARRARRATEREPGRLAFTALAAVPALAVFVWAECYLVAGAAGAVKG